jgi:CHASE2 domain-containing sensor protein
MLKRLFQLIAPYLRGALSVTLIICVGMFSIYFSPFGIADRLDNYSQDLFNTLAGGYEFIYPATGQDKISVLLLTDETVEGLYAGKWPIPYSAHARILNNLLRYAPKAVVIDFLWLNQEKPGVDHLVRVLKRFKHKNIPVYLSFRNAQEPVNFWPELEGLVLPISPKIAVDSTDFVARNYAMENKGLTSSAPRVYQDLFAPDFSAEDGASMQIFWGLKTNQQNAVWMNKGNAKENSLNLFLEGFSAIKYTPPYTTTVLVRDLLNPTAESDQAAFTDLAVHLQNRVVFYGGNITGVSDLVYTPTRQIRPGVYYHAMALDNLISLNGGYKSKDLKKTISSRWHLNAFLINFIILLVPSVIIYSRHRTRERKGSEVALNVQQNRLGTQHQASPEQSSGDKIARHIRTVLAILTSALATRLPLVAWISACVLVCFYLFELSPNNWLGYFAFAELGFYLDNILFFEKTAHRSWEGGHV